MFKQYLQNSKGLTLIELLAVVVILSIISVIAMIAVVNVIADTKKDAQIANAILIVNEAKKYLMAKHIQIDDSADHTISLKQLIDEEYLTPIKDPHSSGYYDENLTKVEIKRAGNNYEYKVTVALSGGKIYIDKEDVFSLTREAIKMP